MCQILILVEKGSNSNFGVISLRSKARLTQGILLLGRLSLFEATIQCL
ncbi:hypothetical protein MCHI_001770 [Candidatus Magnetoovum chiemensis]|nr:hypothetical protein MCHI_001770 [Candidatus Magnetoovum chiemensis]